MILNPARLIIGGGISKAGPRLFEPLRAELARRCQHGRGLGGTLCLPSWGDDSILFGALALASIHL